MADDVSVSFGANLEGILAGFQSIKNQGQQTADGLTEVFNSIEAAVGTLGAALAGITAILAGGAAFEEAVKTVTDLNDTIRLLTLTMGTTAEEASVLNVALHDIGSDAGTYEAAFNKFARTMRTNEEAINSFGITTRDSAGHLRDANTVFMEALKSVNDYKPGLDQTIVAMTMFGRSVQSVHQLQLLLGLDMDEVKAKATALGLVIGDEEQEALLKYKIAMNEAKDVGEGVWHGIGVQLIPGLTALAQAFSGIGPTIVSVTNDAMRMFINALDVIKDLDLLTIDSINQLWRAVVALLTDTPGKVEFWKDLWIIAFTLAKEAVQSLVIGVQVSFTIIMGVFTQVIDFVDGLINALDDLAHLRGKAALEDMGKAFKKMGDDAAESWVRLQKEVNDTLTLFEKGIPEKNFGITGEEWEDKKKPKGTKEAPGATAPADQSPILKAQIEAQKALDKEGIAVALAMYEDYHKQSKIDLQTYFATRLALTQQAIDNEISARNKLLELARTAEKVAPDDKGRIAAQAEQVKLEGEIAVLRAKREEAAIESGRKEADAEAKLNLELVTIREKTNAKLAALDEKRMKSSLDYQKAMGIISEQQYVAGMESLETKRYVKEKEGLETRLALVQDDAKKRAEIIGQLEILESNHQLKLTELERQGEQDRMKYVKEGQDAITSNTETAIQKMIEGHTKLKDILMSFAQSIEAAFAKIAAQKLTQSLVGPGTAGGGFLSSLLGSFQYGTPSVPETGIYQLHEGERVVPKDQNVSGGTGAPLTVYNTFNVPAETTYESRALIASTIGRTLQATRRNM